MQLNRRNVLSRVLALPFVATATQLWTKQAFAKRLGNVSILPKVEIKSAVDVSKELEKLPKYPTPKWPCTYFRDIPIEIGGGYPDFIDSQMIDNNTVGTDLSNFEWEWNTKFEPNEYALQSRVMINKYPSYIEKWALRKENADSNSCAYDIIEGEDFAGSDIKINAQKCHEKFKSFNDKGLDVACGVWPTHLWQHGMKTPAIGSPDYQKAHTEISDVWVKALDHVAYTGFNGTPGLLNNPNVRSIQSRCKEGIPISQINEIVESMTTKPNRLLMIDRYPTSGKIIHKLNSINGIKIETLGSKWFKECGEKAVLYRYDEKAIKMHIPQIMERVMTVPEHKVSPLEFKNSEEREKAFKDLDNVSGYSTLYSGCIGSLMLLDPSSVVYIEL